MSMIVVATFALFILLGYEIRYRLLKEDLVKLGELLNAAELDITRLKADIKLKQNIYEEHEGRK